MKRLNMHKYTLFIWVIICSLLVVLFTILATPPHKNIASNLPSHATCYDELAIYIHYPDSTEAIKLYHDNNQYYAFLPSSVTEETSLTFGNLKADDYIQFNNTVFHATDSINNSFTWEIPYEMTFFADSGVFPSQWITFCKSANIPAVFLNTDSGTTDAIHSDKSIREKATLSIKDSNGINVYHNNIEYISTRGQSSFHQTDKKSYQLKLYKQDLILDMPAAKKWLLIANFIDNSMIRNHFVYNYASNYTNLPSPNGKYVDLYINNEYRGTYYLCEKIEVQENRLNIHNLDKDNEAINSSTPLSNSIPLISSDKTMKSLCDLQSPEDISGGYLISSHPYSMDEIRTGFVTNHGYTYEIVAPQNATLDEVNYIRSLFNEMEDAIYAPNGINSNTGKHFSQYIDIYSFAERYLLEETFHNPDGSFASVYFYKDADSIDPLIHAGPIWDYDRSLGSYGELNQYIDTPYQIGYYSIYSQQLMSHPEFNKLVKELFHTTMANYINNDAKNDILSFKNQIDASASMNKLRWPSSRDYYNSIDASTEYIYLYLKERYSYLNSVWFHSDLYHTVTFLDYDGHIYEQYSIPHGKALTYIPTIASYVAIFNGWENSINGKTLNPDLPILEDTTFQSQWIDANIVLENGIALSEINFNDIDVDALKALINSIENKRSD